MSVGKGIALLALLLTLAAGCQQKKEVLKPSAPSAQVGGRGPQNIPAAARPPASKMR
ncbi:MAG: hypothetical protein QM758_21205 [Armatimonas sp.]